MQGLRYNGHRPGKEAMDPISHLLICAALVGREPGVLLASLVPDLPWYVLYPAWLLSHGGPETALRSAEWPMPPRWIRRIHHATHSLLLLAVGLGAARLLLARKEAKLAKAWLTHILLDIPTHSRQRMGVRIFWPLSRWAYDGTSWADHAARKVAELLRGMRS